MERPLFPAVNKFPQPDQLLDKPDELEVSYGPTRRNYAGGIGDSSRAEQHEESFCITRKHRQETFKHALAHPVCYTADSQWVRGTIDVPEHLGKTRLGGIRKGVSLHHHRHHSCVSFVGQIFSINPEYT